MPELDARDVPPGEDSAGDGLPCLRRLDELVGLVRARPGLFVRYSKGPDDDRRQRSFDYESGLELPGLSTNPLDPEEWWSRPLEDWLSRRLCQYAHLADQEGNDRQAWVLEGTVVGHGPDNEPLVELERPVALISNDVVAEAKRLYEERFDVGNDSTD
ncbi:MAG: hypothetical protein KY412_04435 [Actinobacteria bacterium]|nr:hypothetical protein [Actinomycetota bacterium]